ncbi:hypothetical protein [Clostridium taeniosporum]|uniref:Uncharacterized protein n=1 Tax=Clostridium taeniosporum TaxID=394958 RepID=A0A1D7XKP8_9CLOT|nr:hypothetical protein [Clostridium taeniosporum]AOR23679.1 hypothetical protein BGI42_08015 [Clostridium taeniosporum]
MSNSKENNFLKTVFSFLKSKEGLIRQNELKDDEGNINCLLENNKLQTKTWKKEYNPFRSIVLWGWDNNNNPSFLILYGKHEFKSTESDGESINNILEDKVEYTSYAIFKGSEGHLPSFQAVRIIEEDGYYNRNKDEEFPKMYYKTGIHYSWYWKRDENYLVKEFKNLEEGNKIVLDYFTEISYEECVEKIESLNINFSGFKLAKHPNEILKLDTEHYKYYLNIYNMLSHKNLYMRKKNLAQLIESNPSKEIYDLILKIGSTEVISGLLLELVKQKNPLLIEEAKKIILSDINWGGESYSKGVKRCANIYINSLTKELKKNRERSIREHLHEMDLHLIHIKGKDIPSNKILEGANYRKYAAQELLKEYYGRYDYEKGEWVESRSPKRYKVGLYTDGVMLDTIELKNTIQEAEAYGLADVIGKIAYYLDAPRLTYYFKGTGKGKALKYFKRYIRKIIDSYARDDYEKFMTAMKSLLTSYTKYDYVCKFRGNFQFNEFIKHYLYYDFKEKPPTGWDNWYARYEWMSNDQLMKLKGRYEFMKEIWDNHLEDVLYIAINSNIDHVFKACYYILKDSEKTNELINNMSHKQLIDLTQVSYKPLADMFKKILTEKLTKINEFDSKIMIDLINSDNEFINNLAISFFKRTNGLFKPSDIVDLMFLDNIERWISLFKENLLSLDEEGYSKFVKAIIDNCNRFKQHNISLSKDVRDLLSLSTNKIINISHDEKVDLILYVISSIFEKSNMPEWMEVFIEEGIFSISYEELEDLLKEINIENKQKAISSRSRQVISLLEAIKNNKIPSDAQFISILESGTSQMIKMLFEIVMKNDEELSKRFSTLLIMFESDITILNKKAEEVFDNMIKEDKKNLHGMIIDSPVNKVYLLGLRKLDEIYGDLLPKEFIIQMLEHTSSDVKAYISNKTNGILDNLGDGDEELFMYYVKTLIFIPNRISKSKNNIYEAIPKFVIKHRNKLKEIEEMLLDIGGSNIIIDSERALIALAKIRKGDMCLES